MSYRVVVVGGTSAGKSGIVERFVLGTFVEEYGPTIDEVYNKRIDINSKIYSLDIIDVSGLEEYNTLAEEHMKTADGFIVCYSISSRASFSHVSKVRSALLRVKSNISDIPIVVVATKSDLERDRVVPTSDGTRLAEEWESAFFETSAKENKNIAEPFCEILTRVDAWRIKHPPVVEVPKRSRSSTASRNWRRSTALSRSNDKVEKPEKEAKKDKGEPGSRGGCFML